jgi:hypothetical protein
VNVYKVVFRNPISGFKCEKNIVAKDLDEALAYIRRELGRFFEVLSIDIALADVEVSK